MRKIVLIIAVMFMVGACGNNPNVPPTYPQPPYPPTNPNPYPPTNPYPNPYPPTNPYPPSNPYPMPGISRWYQAQGDYCPNLCSRMGARNVPSPEGSYCMSGEVRPASGIAQGIQFFYGCWGDCSPSNSYIDGQSNGGDCYHSGQPPDFDVTDITVGCHCG